jgi:hypothetical protein
MPACICPNSVHGGAVLNVSIQIVSANQSANLRCRGQTIPVLHYCYTTIVPPSHHHRTTVAPPSHHHRTTIAPLSYHHRTTIAPLSYHHRTTIVPPSYHHRTTIVPPSLSCYIQLPYRYHTVTMLLPYKLL